MIATIDFRHYLYNIKDIVMFILEEKNVRERNSIDMKL